MQVVGRMDMFVFIILSPNTLILCMKWKEREHGHNYRLLACRLDVPCRAKSMKMPLVVTKRCGGY